MNVDVSSLDTGHKGLVKLQRWQLLPCVFAVPLFHWQCFHIGVMWRHLGDWDFPIYRCFSLWYLVLLR